MATTSYPFDSQEVSEAQFSQWAREFQDSGVAGSANGDSLKVSADASGMSVKVQPGFAIVRGFAFLSTAVESVSISSANSSSRIDRVVLRLDPAINSIALAVVKGTPGGGAPSLTQTDTGIYELPLAKVTVGANATNIAASAVEPDRRFTGSRINAWSTTTRPSSPRLAQLGFNTTTSEWEFWDGTQWTALAPTINWSTIDGKPATFAPAAHQHPWADITGKPTVFPPSSHGHDWDEVGGKPSTYPPSSHSHSVSWSSISGKPSSYPASAHYHSYTYITGESDFTVGWANGSRRVRDYGPSGSGYYSVWVDGYDRFCHNTSSIRYKENVRDADEIAPDDVLALRPVIYDRKATEVDGEMVEGAKNEFGLIAEQVAETLPEIVVRNAEGEIDSVRYDLLSVALLRVVQAQAAQIGDLAARVSALEGRA